LRLGLEPCRRTAWAIFAVAALSIMVGVVWLVDLNLQRAFAGWKGESSVVVYLDDTAEEAQVKRSVEELGRIPGVVSAEYVPAAAAAERLRQALAGAESLIEGLDPTAMPASVEISLEPGARDVVLGSALFSSLQGAPGVQEVTLVGEGVDRLASVAAAIRSAARALMVLFSILAICAITATMRLLSRSSSDELAVARLLGAQHQLISRPLMIAGAVQSVVGALVAVPALWWIYHATAPSVRVGLSALIDAPALSFLPMMSLLWLVAAAAALGCLGGALAGRGDAPA
jgi:cell division protein FtsX